MRCNQRNLRILRGQSGIFTSISSHINSALKTVSFGNHNLLECVLMMEENLRAVMIWLKSMQTQLNMLYPLTSTRNKLVCIK